MMQIQIRNATSKDAGLLMELATKCEPLDVHTPYTYWVTCNYYGDMIFIAEHNNEAIGYVMAIETKDTVFLWQIGILEQYRGMKLSQDLIGRVFQIALDKNKAMQTTIADENQASKAAFQSFCNNNELNMESIGITSDDPEVAEVIYRISRKA